MPRGSEVKKRKVKSNNKAPKVMKKKKKYEDVDIVFSYIGEDIRNDPLTCTLPNGKVIHVYPDTEQTVPRYFAERLENMERTEYKKMTDVVSAAREAQMKGKYKTTKQYKRKVYNVRYV